MSLLKNCPAIQLRILSIKLSRFQFEHWWRILLLFCVQHFSALSCAPKALHTEKQRKSERNCKICISLVKILVLCRFSLSLWLGGKSDLPSPLTRQSSPLKRYALVWSPPLMHSFMFPMCSVCFGVCQQWILLSVFACTCTYVHGVATLSNLRSLDNLCLYAYCAARCGLCVTSYVELNWIAFILFWCCWQ